MTLKRMCRPLGLLVLAGAVVGCTYDNETAKTRPTTRPSEAALRDPYGKWSTVDTDITGGGVSNLNRNALKRDMDNFWLK